MKIDLEILRAAEKAGAPAGAIVAMVEQMVAAHEAKRSKKRPIEVAAKRKATERKRKGVESDGSDRNDAGRNSQVDPRPAVPEDPQRARIFGLRPRLVALGLSPERAGTMLGQWRKITRDNASAIETAVASAELKQPADPIGYIRAVLQDRSSINGHRPRTVSDAANDLIARAEEAERTADLGTIDVEFHRVEGG